MSGSGISWAICKSAPCSRQITTPAPHHSVFLQAGCPSCCPTNSVKALKANRLLTDKIRSLRWLRWRLCPTSRRTVPSPPCRWTAAFQRTCARLASQTHATAAHNHAQTRRSLSPIYILHDTPTYTRTANHPFYGHYTGQPFSALTLLVGRQEGHPACKKTERWDAAVVICLEWGADLHMA